MTLLGLSPGEIDARGAHWTAREIVQQPQLWQEIAQSVGEPVHAFLAPLLAMPELRIVLTGAGSSSFIGQCLAPALARNPGRLVRAVATTDLIADPGAFLDRDTPTLLVSFARSGDSPESTAALDLADASVASCHHLVFTCNPQGALARRAGGARSACVHLLPDAANDRSFAMTSSFSGMLLAAALAFGALGADPAALAAAAQELLGGALACVQALVAQRFVRVVFLGAREFKGLAREAALKLLELSDGGVLALADTPLGFRHGPKTVVKRDTLVVVFLSNDAAARRYDLDLLRELRADAQAGRVLALDARPGNSAPHADDLLVPALAGAPDLALCLPFVVFAQLLALCQSLALGLRPDEPNAAGVVSRVVRGVTIHPMALRR